MGNKKGPKRMIQTWLPLPSYKDSIRALSQDDLIEQRLCVLELIEYAHDVEDTELPDDYTQHSDSDLERCYRMWLGHELQLIEYGLEACDEYSSIIGKRDPFYEKIAQHLEYAEHENANFNKPSWFGDVDFHLAHQAALVRKNFSHYNREFQVRTDRKLIWPVSDLYKETHEEEA